MPRACDGRGTFCDRNLGTELLCLRVRTRRQQLARDTGWKPQIIFDAGARSCLSTGDVRFEDEDIESFRCAVHGSGQTRWTGTHDHDVADMRPVDRVIEA